MSKLLTTGIAAIFSIGMLTMVAAPANAFGFGFGGGHHHGIDFEFDLDDLPDLDVSDDDDDDVTDAHTEWCDAHYKTYDEDTNLYYYAPGKQRECVSPFS